jgi:hypothetical protein
MFPEEGLGGAIIFLIIGLKLSGIPSSSKSFTTPLSEESEEKLFSRT